MLGLWLRAVGWMVSLGRGRERGGKGDLGALDGEVVSSFPCPPVCCAGEVCFFAV
jgi:hypothetical protein